VSPEGQSRSALVARVHAVRCLATGSDEDLIEGLIQDA
jgi:hypothetical protein